MQFIIVIEVTSGQPRMIPISEIRQILATPSTAPALLRIEYKGGGFIDTTTVASTAVTGAIAAGIAADLRP